MAKLKVVTLDGKPVKELDLPDAVFASALNVVDLLAHDTVVLSEAAVQRVSEVLSP